MPLWGGGALIENATICTHRYMGNFSEFGVSRGAGLGTAGGSQRTCSHTDTVSEHSNCTQGLIPGLCESNLQPATSVFQNLKLIFLKASVQSRAVGINALITMRLNAWHNAQTFNNILIASLPFTRSQVLKP